MQLLNLSVLESLVAKRIEELENERTSVESCKAAAESCLKVINTFAGLSASFKVQQDLEELEQKFIMMANLRPSGPEGDPEEMEEEKVFSRYCTIQVIHSIRKLIDTVR